MMVCAGGFPPLRPPRLPGRGGAGAKICGLGAPVTILGTGAGIPVFAGGPVAVTIFAFGWSDGAEADELDFGNSVGTDAEDTARCCPTPVWSTRLELGLVMVGTFAALL
mmetsp:Transcript_526/g.828  ORF Transcript_526/g.828 Transcript_526/m.828 type:complete len:109 (+) Transcript_526:1599-1925(+)